jgi:hypothetical protein
MGSSVSQRDGGGDPQTLGGEQPGQHGREHGDGPGVSTGPANALTRLCSTARPLRLAGIGAPTPVTLLFGGDPDRCTGRQVEVTHGLAVGDGYCVEAQVKLSGQVEWHALRSL